MPQQIDFDPNVDYYKALGVAQKATADEIKKQYRKLAKENHPDSTGGDKAKEARFKNISNAYDVLGDEKKRSLYDQIRAGGGSYAPQGFPGAGGNPFGGGGGRGGPGVFDLNDLFSQFVGGQQRGGRVNVEQMYDDEPEEVHVRLSDGTTARVDGSGDVHSDARISFDRAILGTVVTVATLDGKSEMKIPPGTSSGKRLRLRGKGKLVGRGRSQKQGDHFVTVQIDVPSELDEDAKKQLILLVTRLRKRGQTE